MINTSFWKGKKVFLTGHTGFKGTWLSIWLYLLGVDVRGYAMNPNTIPSLFNISNSERLLNSVIGDIRDLNKLKEALNEFKPDIVIHMAAQPLVHKSYQSPVETYETNVMGTVNILEAIRYCSSVKAFINVTTDKVYENQEWLWGYRETDKLGGYDPYSNSKVCSELVTTSYGSSFFNPNEYKKHGVAIATARAGNVIGGGDWGADRIIPDIMKAINNNNNLLIRNPNAIRPWQHVLEPLSGYLMLAERLFNEGIKWQGAWNFGPRPENSKSVQELIGKFQECYGVNICVEIKKDSVMHETSVLKVDAMKSRSLLTWTSDMSFEEVVKLTAEWYRDYSSVAPIELCKEQITNFQRMNLDEKGNCYRS